MDFPSARPYTSYAMATRAKSRGYDYNRRRITHRAEAWRRRLGIWLMLLIGSAIIVWLVYLCFTK